MTSLTPLKYPLRFSRPVDRVSFWTFHVLASVLILASTQAHAVLGHLTTSSRMSLAADTALLAAYAYLGLAMTSTMAGRLLDAGMRRAWLAGLGASLVLFTGALLTDLRAHVVSLEDGYGLPGRLALSPATVLLGVLTCLTGFVVFRGLIRPTAPRPDAGTEGP